MAREDMTRNRACAARRPPQILAIMKKPSALPGQPTWLGGTNSRGDAADAGPALCAERHPDLRPYRRWGNGPSSSTARSKSSILSICCGNSGYRRFPVPSRSRYAPAAPWRTTAVSYCIRRTGRRRDSLEVDESYVLTASLDILRAIAEGGGPARSFLALGYASWGPGQLDDEILQNVWLTVPSDEAIVFDADYPSKWSRALGKLRIDPGMLSGDAGRA